MAEIDKEIGEFDPSAPGYYRNVETTVIDVRRRRKVHVVVSSDSPVDVSVIGTEGTALKFVEGVEEFDFSTTPAVDGKMAVVAAVYPGDKARIKVKVEA